MKTIKPQKIGVLTHVFEDARQPYLVVSLLGFFAFDDPGALLSEVAMWKLVGEELGPGAPLDAGMPKSRGELLVTGRAYPGGSEPRPACSVRVTLGAVDKTLYVAGDRRWKSGVPTEPAPFSEMPLGWASAFGGKGFAANPLGKGAAAIETPEGEVVPLPNVEDPAHLLRSPKERPAPVGFGACDISWPQRISKAGTYDEAWMRERFPGFARDLDWALWNAAPEDQQIEGYFRGDEAFAVENMHASRPRIASALPGVVTRAFIRRKAGAEEALREIPTRLDTVHLFPHRERGLLVFRGVTKVAEDDAADVAVLLAACEALGAPRPAAHYEEVLARRMERKKGHLHALRDGELMPAAPPREGRPRLSEPSEISAVLAREGLQRKHLRRHAEAELDRARERMRALGLDPSKYLPPALPPDEPRPDVEDLPALVEAATGRAERAKAEAADARAGAEARARKLCAERNVDYDALVEDAKGRGGGPPKLRARAELDKLRALRDAARASGVRVPNLEAKLADPDLEKKLALAEEKLVGAYKRFAHHFPAASRLEGEPAARLRAEVVAGREAGRSFAGRDLTGADLAHLDLSGADFAGAMLERASLAGSSLAGADLRGAVLARADLTGVDLTGARLAGVNLGHAILRGVKAGGGVDLSGAVLAKADLGGADLRGARMAKTDLSEARFDATDMSGATATGLRFLSSDLRGLKLAGAELCRCCFLSSDVSGVDFSGATLTGSVFVRAKGEKAVFRGARLENLRVVEGSSFAGADFGGALLEKANLRGTDLSGSDFSHARMSQADLSECDLRGARFYRAVARGARFAKADLSGADLTSVDLLQAILLKAKLSGAIFKGASLFQADLALVDADQATSFEDAEVTHVRIHPRRIDAKV
jgi:uncharacterized protein YjbI with pentapeptide repeats